jgi:hypothetical protein
MIVLSFETWEDYDNAIAGIASAFASASVAEEEEMDCARCGEWVKPSEHPSIGCDI